MADIALVTLELDSTGVVSGEKKATASLRLVESQMQRTEKQAQQLNTSLNTNVRKSGEAFKGLSDSAHRAGVDLQALGGPIGNVAGQLTGAVAQVQDFTASLGLIGGIAAGAIAGVTALASAFVRLTLEGVAVSDQLGDIAESTGLTIDQVQRLGAAAKLSGEDVGLIERAFRTFEGAVAEAQDPASKAAANFRALGIDAKAAGKDTGAAFIDAVANLKAYRSTTEGAAASTELLGRGVGALIRSSGNLTEILKANRTQLEAAGVIATLEAVEAGQRLDTQINNLSNSWTVFTQNLAASSTGGFMTAAVDDLNSRLRESEGLLDGIVRLLGFVSTSNVSQLILNAGAAEAARARGSRPQSFFDEWRGGQQTATAAAAAAPRPPGRPGGGRSAAQDDALRAEEQFQRERLRLAQDFGAVNARFWEQQLDEMNANSKALIKAIVDAPAAAALQRIAELQQQISGGGLQGDIETITAEQAGLTSGVTDRRILRTEEQARLDEQFSVIFDDMLVSILTAQKTLGGAFAGLAFGIVDTFAVEFTKELRRSFIDPIIRDLTDMLQSAVKDIFGGLSAGGLKGVFGGIAKGIGTIFGGFFGAGGTLGANKFGVVGERGAELIYSGASPLHVAPMATNTSGMNFTLVQNIHAPDGSVSKRTQDQMADSMLRAVERANRNRGAR